MSTYQPASKSDITVVRWGVHWRTPVTMVLLFIAGIAFAVGHHIFYRSLDGTVVTSTSQQEWTIRIGTGLAFLVKATLAASIGISFTQYLWTIARTKAMSVGSIDAMFSLTKNPLAFTNFEVLWKAKLLVVLALASWLMPLIATVTPGTISVESRTVTNTINGRVPSIDFARDEALWSDSMGVGLLVSASPAVSRLLSAVASSVGIIPITAPFPNSSFTLQFHAPAFKCESLADAINNGQPVGNCANCTSLQTLFDSTIDLTVNYYYWQAAKPLADNSLNLFFIRTGESKQGAGDFKSISCQLWNASYTTQFMFMDGVQTTLIQDLAYKSVISFDLAVQFSQLPLGGRAYLAMYLAMSDLLSGGVGFRPGTSSSGMAGINLPVARTGLMACPDVLASWKARGSQDPPLDQVTLPWMCRNSSVAAAVEDLFQNLTLSLLSSELLSGNTSTDIQVTSPRNFWRYGPVDLLISYVAGVAVAFVALVFGGWALIANGYSGDVSFSSILLTTRNPDLDGIAMGQCLGARPLDQNFGKHKLQFGIVGRTDGIEHAAFGIRGNVQELRKGQECI